MTNATPQTPEQREWFTRGLLAAHAEIIKAHDEIEHEAKMRAFFVGKLLFTSRMLERIGKRIVLLTPGR